MYPTNGNVWEKYTTASPKYYSSLTCGLYIKHIYPHYTLHTNSFTDGLLSTALPQGRVWFGYWETTPSMKPAELYFPIPRCGSSLTSSHPNRQTDKAVTRRICSDMLPMIQIGPVSRLSRVECSHTWPPTCLPSERMLFSVLLGWWIAAMDSVLYLRFQFSFAHSTSVLREPMHTVGVNVTQYPSPIAQIVVWRK